MGTLTFFFEPALKMGKNGSKASGTQEKKTQGGGLAVPTCSDGDDCARSFLQSPGIAHNRLQTGPASGQAGGGDAHGGHAHGAHGHQDSNDLTKKPKNVEKKEEPKDE